MHNSFSYWFDHICFSSSQFSPKLPPTRLESQSQFILPPGISSAQIHEASGRPQTRKTEFWLRCSYFHHHDSEWYLRVSVVQGTKFSLWQMSLHLRELGLLRTRWWTWGRQPGCTFQVRQCVRHWANAHTNQGLSLPLLGGEWDLCLLRSLLGSPWRCEKLAPQAHCSGVDDGPICNKDPSVPWPCFWNRT